MAFEVPTDRIVPESTTVAGFTLQRLAAPVLRVKYNETTRGWLDVLVSEKVDATTLVINEFIDNPSAAPGIELFLADDTSIGTISDYIVLPAVPATETDPGSPAKGQATITGVGLAADAPATLKRAMLNAFGIQAQLPVVGGRQWELVFPSEIAASAAKMQSMLGSITVAVVAAALAQLGVVKTVEEIGAAVQAMAAAGDSLDSLIASEFEQLEKDRRSGALPSTDYMPVGSVPSA